MILEDTEGEEVLASGKKNLEDGEDNYHYNQVFGDRFSNLPHQVDDNLVQ